MTELANLLQLHAATIRLWLREDRLPGARKDGRKWLIRGDDVARLLAENPDTRLRAPAHASRPASTRASSASDDARPRSVRARSGRNCSSGACRERPAGLKPIDA